MAKITIYLGSKNKSPWSLSTWLMLLQTGIDFEAVFIQLDRPDTKEKIAKISSSKQLPILRHAEQSIWGALAIGEYLAEIFPRVKLWPPDLNLRAVARCIAYETHTGFQAVGRYLLFTPQENITREPLPEDVQNEINRIFYILEDCRNKYSSSGKFLFGNFSIADAMLAPVISQFLTHHIPLSPLIENYASTIMKLPEMQMWYNDV